MTIRMRWAAIAAAIAIVIGGAVTAFALAGASHSTLNPANQRVCAHLIVQKRWFVNLSRPSIADVFKLYEYLAVDASEANGHLRTDLKAAVAASGSAAGNAIGTRVARDCKYR